VTHAFLRSLAKLDLAKSKIGRLSMIVPAVLRPSQRHNGETADREKVSSTSNQP
jgi:hypothetical protein